MHSPNSPKVVAGRRKAGGVASFLPLVMLAVMVLAIGPQSVWAQVASPHEHATAGPEAAAAAVVSAIEVAGDARRTTVSLVVDRPVGGNIFTLAAPYRAIVDSADLEFRLPAGAGRTGHGVVAGFRYGQFEAGRSRVVLDAVAPVRIENARFERVGAGVSASLSAGVAGRPRQPGLLVFDLVQITEAEYAALSPATSPAAALRPTVGKAGAAQAAGAQPPVPGPAPVGLRSSLGDGEAQAADHKQADRPPPPEIAKPGARARPLIVLDPGHGGIDPGTVASSNLTEKTVVLAVARELAALLQQGRRFDVRMTRHDDMFVSLDQRLDASRRLAADLFISIHADSLASSERDFAQAVRGATVYTLSERASDEAARLLADKENAADQLAGLDAVPASDEDQVRNILFDLVRRETSNHAAEFRQHLIGALKGRVPLAKDPQRAAAFKVLKQPETPAVLIELGYMSNAEDLARLSRSDWQRQVAGAIAAAVEAHFAQRLARTKLQRTGLQ